MLNHKIVGRQLVFISSLLFHTIKLLLIFHRELDENELICDCDIAWLLKQSTNTKRGASDGSKCKYPKSLNGKRLKYLADKKWNCSEFPHVIVSYLSYLVFKCCIHIKMIAQINFKLLMEFITLS